VLNDCSEVLVRQYISKRDDDARLMESFLVGIGRSTAMFFTLRILLSRAARMVGLGTNSVHRVL
jgi:hypothetical protein